MQALVFELVFYSKNAKCVRSCLNHLWPGVSTGQFKGCQANIDTYYD